MNIDKWFEYRLNHILAGFVALAVSASIWALTKIVIYLFF